MPISLAADIHCHLLPNWDDGPASPQESLALAARLAQCGVGAAFVTPHVDREGISRSERAASQIAQAVQSLQSQVDEAGIALELVPGAEVMLAPGLAERLPNEPWLLLGANSEGGERAAQTRYILVEMGPGAPWTPEVDALLFQIALQGITPILAHPERYPDIQRDTSIARALATRGVLLQISASSLLSRGATSSTARALLQQGLAAVIASDAHSAAGVVIEQAAAQIESLLGPEAALQVLVENPRRILEGRAVSVTPREPHAPPSLWSRWFGRGGR